MNATNLNIVLTNALCCSSQLATKVGKLYGIGNLCVDTEFDKLKLLIDKIEVLKCYSFPTEINTLNTDSEFYTTLTIEQYKLLSEILYLTIQLNINGTIYTIVSDDVSDAKKLILDKLIELGIIVSVNLTKDSLLFVLTCDILNIDFTVQYGSELPVSYLFTNTVLGICPSTIIIPANKNCLTEEQADIMMQDIMRQCDICQCQLT